MKEDKVTQAASPDAAAEIQASAAQERSRILGIQSALAGAEFKAVSDRAIAEGWDLMRAKAEAFDVAQSKRAEDAKAFEAKLADAAAKQAESQQRLDAIAKSGHAEEILGQADTTVENPLAKTQGDDAKAVAFEKGITELIASGNTRANSIAKMVRRDAAGHKAWVASKQKK